MATLSHINANGASLDLVTTTSTSPWFGEFQFFEGDVENEVYPWSIARSDGFGINFSGNRQAIHTAVVRWTTTNPTTVKNTITALRKRVLFGPLTVTRSTGTLSYQYCWLSGARKDHEIRGVLSSNGAACAVLQYTLTFTQNIFS